MTCLIPYANLIEGLEAAPADRPFVTNWVDEDEQETVTFGEFRDRARGQAIWIAKNGVTSGDRVVIVMPQGIAAMATFVGAMMLGAVPAFLAYPNFKVEARKYRSGLAGVSANLSARAVVIDRGFPEDMLAYVALDGQTNLLRAEEHAVSGMQFTHPAIGASDLAFLQHSAGTTGLQKGVALTHAAVLRQLRYLAVALRVNPSSDRIYSWLPLYHDMGLIACFMLPMVSHTPLVMQSPLEWVMRPESMLQIIDEHRCTLSWMPNFAFQFAPRRTPKDRRKKYDLSSLRAVINCSEPVRDSSMREFQEAFGVRSEVLQSSYAMAENVFAVSQSEVGRTPGRVWADGQEFRGAHRIAPVQEDSAGAITFTSSGRVLPGQKVRIRADSGRELGEGCVGEILIQGDCLFDGYYNRPDLTAEAIEDGWYRTGDLGFMWEGELYVVGRKKDLLIIGGENVYPQDIEEIVASHPAVHDGRAIAFGVYNSDLGTEDVVVVAELQSHDLLSQSDAFEQEIRQQIVAGMGVAVRKIFLRPPKWIVKSTAGKPARSATREKLLLEHPELGEPSAS